MKRSFYAPMFLAAALLLGTEASRAADPAKAHDYFEIMGIGKANAALIPSMTHNMFAGLKQDNPNLPADVQDIVTKVVTDMMTPLLPQMQAATEKVYADNLTDEEITAATAFYRTPAGQSLLKKLPTITQQGMQASHGIVMAHFPELQQKLAEEIKKRHPELK